MEYKDPGRYIPIIYLLYSWGSQFGVPSRVPLDFGSCPCPVTAYNGVILKAVGCIYNYKISIFSNCYWVGAGPKIVDSFEMGLGKTSNLPLRETLDCS